MSIAYRTKDAPRLDQSPNLDLRFPPLPRSVSEVSRLMSDGGKDPNTPRLVEVIHSDPVMAAAVLRRINSAFFGMRRHVTEIKKAVFLLGFLDVSNIVLTSAMLKLREIVSTPAQEKIFETVMRSSVGTAAFALEIASFLNLPSKELAFTSGLLHGSGRLVLLCNKPNEYERLFHAEAEGVFPSAETEHEYFGMDHAQLNELAGDHWNLPDEVTEIIAYYLRPGHIKDESIRKLALTVAVGASATEQLCMIPGRDDLEFEAKTALRVLARTSQTTTDKLIDLIETRRQIVSEYISTMVYC